jgi:hypothetical protein
MTRRELSLSMHFTAPLPLTLFCCVAAIAAPAADRVLDAQDISMLRRGTEACYRVYREQASLPALLTAQGWRSERIGIYTVLVQPRPGGGEYIAYFYPDSLEGPYGCTLVIPDVPPTRARAALAELPDPRARAFFASVEMEGETDTIIRIRDAGGEEEPPFHLPLWWASKRPADSGSAGL